jgi:hypothetical protein
VSSQFVRVPFFPFFPASSKVQRNLKAFQVEEHEKFKIVLISVKGFFRDKAANCSRFCGVSRSENKNAHLSPSILFMRSKVKLLK